MLEAISCGGVVFHKGKVLLLYKNQSGRYDGWVLPKGTLETGETFKQTALREVKEESGVTAKIIKYLGKTEYNFKNPKGTINKTVHWYLMVADDFKCKPQAEECFTDAGYYKRHEALHLMKFTDEKQMVKKAFIEYSQLKRNKRNNNDMIFKQGVSS